MGKVHLLRESAATVPSTACSLFDPSPNVQVTRDAGEVTCRTCQARLDKEAMDALAGYDHVWMMRDAKQSARSKAVSLLIERHRDEFDRLVADLFPAAVNESKRRLQR